MVKKAEVEDPFEKTLHSLNKKFDLESVAPKEVEALSTGNMAIDLILGVGGIPLGRNVELYGDPSSGKSTVALQTAAALQRQIIAEDRDEYIIYYDYENTVDLNYGVSLGLKCMPKDIDPKNYHKSWKLFQPDTLEQGTNHARSLIETGKVRLIIWDSVAEMTPADLFDKETGQATVALRARLMSQFLQQTSAPLRTHRCTNIFLNHSMDDIGISGPGQRPGIKKKTTPGGKSLKYHSSVRLEFTQIKSTKTTQFNPLTNMEEEVSSSNDVLVKVVKNKVADPFKQCVVRVRYGRGFDNFWTAVQVLKAYKHLGNTAGYYYFHKLPHLTHDDMDIVSGHPSVRGEENLMKFADSHPDWRDLVIAEAEKVLNESSTSGSSLDLAVKEDIIGSLLNEEE